MKYIKNTLFIAITLIASYNTLRPMNESNDIDEFVMVENNPNAIEINNDLSTSKKVEHTIENAKKMLTKAEDNLSKIKNAVDSEEVSRFVSVLQKMKDSLKKMAFKNGPGFQITNKTESPIWISLIIGDHIQSNQDEYNRDQIASGEKLTMEIQDLNKDMMIAVYTQDPEIVTFDGSNLTPRPTYIFATTEGARGKTKYLTWNPEKHNMMSKYLYPQTGRLAGMVKVSRSNYNLDNNIKSFQLKLKEQR